MCHIIMGKKQREKRFHFELSYGALKFRTDIAVVNIIHEMSSLIQVFREISIVLIDSVISSAHIWASIDHYWCAQCFCVDQLLSVNKASVKSV